MRRSVIVRSKDGFTLIELMVVVAIVAVLAAVVIPSFFREASRTRGEAEVAPMFAELATRQEAYKVEYGRYLSTGASETATHPSTTTGSTAQNVFTGMPAAWTTLKVHPPVTAVRCVYVSLAGEAGDPTNIIGPEATSFGFTAPGTVWYYLLARCDLDGNSSLDSFYFQSSVDSKLLKRNQGR